MSRWRGVGVQHRRPVAPEIQREWHLANSNDANRAVSLATQD